MSLPPFHYPKAGLPPGSLIYVGTRPNEPLRIVLIRCRHGQMNEQEVRDIESLPTHAAPGEVMWINVTGLADSNSIAALGHRFDLHPLALEDIMNTHSRPKMDEYSNWLFLVLKALTFDEQHEHVRREHVAIAASRGVVLTFQEALPDDFEGVRTSLRKNPAMIGKHGADYLAYLLMDAIVDRYFAVLEAAGERINRLDEELTERPKSSTLRRIQSLKTELMRLRRNIWPVREVLGQLAAMPERRVSAYTKDYLRDTQEHTMEMLDMVEMYRDMLSTMVEVYLSSVSNKTNEVMKVLTVFGTVFMPLTFIVGIYGMNFRNLPELNWELGYYAVWAVMLAVTGVMLLYFKRKGWF